MNRRSFIKALGVLAATPALGKYLNVFKSAPIREGIAEGASMGMDFFNLVIKKVMDEGAQVGEADRIATFRHPDRADILVEVDKASGDTTVLFEADSGTKSMMQKVNTMDETTKGKTFSDLYEAEEVYGPMGREEQEGITGGITNLEEFIKKRKFAMGGRVNLRAGGIPKALQAAMQALKKKFGKDAIKNVEDTPEYFDNYEISPYFNINRPESAIKRDKFSNFGKPGKFNEDGTVDYDYYAQILNDSENTFVTGDETIEELEFMLKEHSSEMEYLYNQYKTGKLDPVAGEKTEGRKRFLQNKLDEAESSGDNRLITRDEMDELESFDLSVDDIKQGDEITSENFGSSQFAPKKGKVIESEADMLMQKYPGMDKNLADQIANEINPRKKADIIAMVEQTIEMGNKGMSGDDIIQTFKNTPRTKQASGGIIGLTTKPRSANSKAGVETLRKGR